jgi:beta-phosphoglucomutase-like phosphatase (HAD superfamily)
VLRALLFDFNGVLVDDEPLHLELLLRVLAEEGVVLRREESWPRFLGLGDRDSFAQALTAAGQQAPPQRLVRLVARKASYYREAVRRHGYTFFPGALELVRGAAAGLVLGVVSGARARVRALRRRASGRTTSRWWSRPRRRGRQTERRGLPPRLAAAQRRAPYRRG